ncbi:LOW QUALITY PROTEIN: L-seryl-tRNA(Sec) kinase-like [Oncorhynchus keta]|uniref:LOW QUALITY PROTEIN: L-seryl-tRNA(Sec) kinase-like n=1 Tax=Oncorhynchus keta TaxID=8018 RepID=UPI00227B5669|nr:LOW QUALITY PROTEIN: L-seryl-tRNA(Sec) kinase-like [Oncorhynchus keta]
MDLNEDSVNAMCTRICLCVLCGLPAAGKSTLAQAVNSHSAQRGWRSAVISYDDLIPGDAFNVKEVQDEQDIPRSQTQTEWKGHRQEVLRCVEQFLQSPTDQLPPIIYQINRDARSRLLHAAQVCGTPAGSSRVCGTPAGSSQVCGTPAGSSRVCGTPVGSSRVCGTPAGSSRVCGTPAGSSRVCGTPAGSSRVCGTPTGSSLVCGTPAGSSQAYPSPSDRPPPPLVILLDDNFYYPSMRYEVYQLARKHSVGFCQVYVHCPVESCVRRNQLRPQPLPSDVIVEMAKRMEPPNPQRNSWEQNSVTLDSEHHFTIEYIQRLVKVISTALENPLSPVQDNTEQQEADRQSCVSSVVHQADQACRRLVSQAMQEAREHQLPPERMRSLAADFNESKTTFLQDLRRQVLRGLPLTRGEDVEVERVVTRAVDVFNKEKRDLIARYLPPYDRIK